MIKHRKGLVVEALMRIIIMAVLVFIVWKIGKTAYAAAFGEGNTLNEFDDFVGIINSAQFKAGEAKQELLTLDPGTAIIGFSKDKDYKCQSRITIDKLESTFKRPLDAECKDSACICMCLKGLPTNMGSQQPLQITCEKLVCKKVKDDIAPIVEIGSQKGTVYGYTYQQSSLWEGGFLYVRDAGTADIAMSGLPKNDKRTIAIILEKQIVDGKTYIGVCPALPCVQIDNIKKYLTKTNIN